MIIPADTGPISIGAAPDIDGMLVFDWTPTNGQTFSLPPTNHQITLNVKPAGALATLNIVLPTNADGEAGQRVFVNISQTVETVTFSAGALQVNNPVWMSNPGDNCVYYRNEPGIWSRITA